MRKMLIVAAIAALVLASCLGPTGPDHTLQSVAEMEEGAQETIDLLMEASASGDRTELDSFLRENDPSGELTAIADEALAASPSARWIDPYPPPPPFDESIYGDGDVLVFSGTGTITSLLFDLILINAYGHAGIVDRTMVDTATAYTSGTPCIVSSTLPEGVRYQTYEELVTGNETWTLLSVSDNAPGVSLAPGWGEAFTTAYPTDETAYSFLHLDFRPVSREDSFWWYCSKVPYRVWRDLAMLPPEVDRIELEATWLYELGDSEGIWTIQRQSILYRIYAYWYNCLPWWMRRHARTPDQVLVEALDELVTPDELRAVFGSTPKATWGDPTPEYVFSY